MSAIELAGDVDREQRLSARVPESLPPGPVRVLLLPAEGPASEVKPEVNPDVKPDDSWMRCYPWPTETSSEVEIQPIFNPPNLMIILLHPRHLRRNLAFPRTPPPTKLPVSGPADNT